SRLEFWKRYRTVQICAHEVGTKTRQQPLSITLDKALNVWWETVESGSRESALHSILFGVCSMESFSDFFCNSLHLFCWYVLHVLCIHEFCMTISWKSRDHMDVRVWHAHSSNISDHPPCVHGLLESLRDHPNGLEVPSSFRADSTLGPVAVTLRTRPPDVTSCPFGVLAVPAWNMTMLLLAKGRSAISSPAEGFSGYPLDARTTTTDADSEDSGNGGLSEL